MSRRSFLNVMPDSFRSPMWSSSDMIPALQISTSSRRGNTLVLVTAILVLLVIIATAFISRTQDGRQLAKSQQAAYERSDNVSVLKDQLAKDIATSLFARPVDGNVQQDAYDAYGIFEDSADVGFIPEGDPDELRAEATLSGLPRSTVVIPEGVFDSSGDFSYDDVALGYDRFGLDQNSTFDFNFAPYETRPWTNWPDDVDLRNTSVDSDPLALPFGPGATFPDPSRFRDFTGRVYGVGNPRGNPGYGDTRWLRDTEPRRLGNYYGGPYAPTEEAQDPFVERYSHWTHLSWIPSPENGWRVCYDISNVASLDPYRFAGSDFSNGPGWGFTLSTVATDGPEPQGDRPYHDASFPVAIQTPYEQWYPNVIPTEIPRDDYSGEFQRRRDLWFHTPRVHFGNGGMDNPQDGAIRRPEDVLPNYIDLNALYEPDGSLNLPEDAFIRGTARNVVERTFCDADGDGFTDSFWFVPSSSGRPGVKQVVGVSIIDNNSMLDVNVATVFDRWSTSGATPADAALVSRLGVPSDTGGIDLDDFDTWTGLLGDPKNWTNGFYKSVSGPTLATSFDEARWYSDSSPAAQTMMNARGVDKLRETDDGDAGPFYGQYRTLAGTFDLPESGVRERKLWNNLVQNDFTGTWVDRSPVNPVAIPYVAEPFGADDEIELRAFSGLNHPTRFTRLEGVLGNHVTTSNVSASPLRSDINVSETAPLRQGQSLTNPTVASGKIINEQQVRDMRHRMTTLTGVRNEYRPLWLWQTPYFNRSFDYDRDGQTYADGDFNDYDEYQTRRRKIDLRQSLVAPGGEINDANWVENRRLWLDDLQEVITRATTLTAFDPITSRSIPQGYFTDSGWSLDDSDEPSHGSTSQTKFQDAYLKSLRLAPSLAANIEAFRDGPIEFGRDGGGQSTLFPPTSDPDQKPAILIDQPIHPQYALRPPTYDPNTGDTLPDVDLDGDGQTEPLRDDSFIGFEKQPFIMQAFYGAIYPKSSHQGGLGGCWDAGDEIPVVQNEENCQDGYFVNATTPGGSPDPTGPATGERYVDDTSKPFILLAIQLGNPFDEPLSLYDYSLKIGKSPGQIPLRLLDCPHPETADVVTGGHQQRRYYADQLYLGPTEPEAPRTAVVFALIPPTGFTVPTTPEGNATYEAEFGLTYDAIKAGCLDFLDLAPGELYGYEPDMPLRWHESLVFDASIIMTGRKLDEILSQNDDQGLGSSDERPLIQLVRNIYPPRLANGADAPDGINETANVVVDRLQNNRIKEEADPRHNGNEIADKLDRFLTAAAPPKSGNSYVPSEIQAPGPRFNWSGIRLGTDGDFYFTWASVSRFWGWDVDANGMYDLNEVSPRFVYSVTSEPKCAFEIAPDLAKTELDGPEKDDASYALRDVQGDILTLSQFEPGGPDTMGANAWATTPLYTLPVTKVQQGQPLWKWQDGPLQDYEPGYGLWQHETNRPDPWKIRGKPFNFPTWTVVDESDNPVYGKGFPLETVWNQTAAELAVTERTVALDDSQLQLSQYDIVPMDMVALEQTEFFQSDTGEGWREDLWASPLQMLLKDADFEQIGELNHVFLWGPVLNGEQGPPPAGGNYVTKQTFSELLTNVIEFERPNLLSNRPQFVPEWWGMTETASKQLPADEYPVSVGIFANRLDFGQGRTEQIRTVNGRPSSDPGRPWRQVLGAGNLLVSAYRPLLPSGAGIFDAVTVDGIGTAVNDYDFDGSGDLSLVEQLAAEENRFNLARGFTGQPTRGMVNINTAPIEVMRALPQMSRLIYNDYFVWDHGIGSLYQNRKGRNRRSGYTAIPAGTLNEMHTRFAEAIDRYRMGDVESRDGGLDASDEAVDSMPSYVDRGFRGINQPNAVDFVDLGQEFLGFFPGMRNDRGFVSIGELLAMTRTQFDENRVLSGGSNITLSLEWEGKSASVRSFGENPYEVTSWNAPGVNRIERGFDYPSAQIPNQVSANGKMPAFGDIEYRDYALARYRLGWRGDKVDEDTNSAFYSIPIQNQVDARVSTDRNTERLNLNWLRGLRDVDGGAANEEPVKVFRPDNVGGDAEEAALLFSGIANMLTTRSDVFTVYFKVRTFSQDPTTGLWDATDKDRIIDESRYMMVIDRSSVSRPTDEPKILSFTKVE